MKKNHVWLFILALGLTHGIADAASGYGAGYLAHQLSVSMFLQWLLVYNVIAFLLQPLFGWIVDRWQCYRFAIVLGPLVMAVSFLLLSISLPFAVISLAVGSALFHVSAGAVSAFLLPNQAKAAAVFSAPGVVGLALGTFSAIVDFNFYLIAILLLICASLMLFLASISWQKIVQRNDSQKQVRGVLAALLLVLLGVVIRSALWNVIPGLVTTVMVSVYSGIFLALAAGFGKLFGGFFADRFGKKIVLALPIVGVIFLFYPHLATLLLGVFCLQASTPVILAFLVQRFPNYAATVSGLVQGSAIALGGVGLLFREQVINGFPLFLFLVSIVFWIGFTIFPSKVKAS